MTETDELDGAEADQGVGPALEPIIDDGAPPPVRASEQFVEDFRVPWGWELWADGLYQIDEVPDEDDLADPSLGATPSATHRKTLKLVASSPIWIRRFGRDLGSGGSLVELGFLDPQTRLETWAWVPKQVIADWRRLLQLAEQDVPVNSGNATKLVYYLDRAAAINAQYLPWVDVSQRLGAVSTKAGWGWLLGDIWIGPKDTNVVADPTLGANIASGYGVSGSRDAWLDKFEEIVSIGSVPRWLCYSTFAGPLLRHIARRTFVIHHWGKTASGKSSLSKFAQSAWGDAHKLTETFNRTEKSFTELFEQTSDFPLSFDELQASTSEDLSSVIYHLTLQKGRGRSKKAGGIERSIEEWRSVIRMNGEEPLIGRSQVDRGGQSNRVLQIAAAALTEEKAGALHRWMDQGHYGWGGKLFLEHLQLVLRTSNGAGQLQIKFAEIRRDIDRETYRPLGDRINHLAVIALAQMLASVWLFGGDPKLARSLAINDAEHIAELLLEDTEQSPPMTEVALQLLRDHVTSESAQWPNVAEANAAEMIAARRGGRLAGILRPDLNEVWVLQRPSNLMFKREGLAPRAVWRELREKKALVLRSGRSFAVTRTLGAFQNKVYVLRWDALFPLDETTGSE